MTVACRGRKHSAFFDILNDPCTPPTICGWVLCILIVDGWALEILNILPDAVGLVPAYFILGAASFGNEFDRQPVRKEWEICLLAIGGSIFWTAFMIVAAGIDKAAAI